MDGGSERRLGVEFRWFDIAFVLVTERHFPEVERKTPGREAVRCQEQWCEEIPRDARKIIGRQEPRICCAQACSQGDNRG